MTIFYVKYKIIVLIEILQFLDIEIFAGTVDPCGVRCRDCRYLIVSIATVFTSSINI